MATLKVNGTSYLVMSNKVTTPSIIIQGVGYIPLFQSSGSTIDYLRYRYTLGNLRVGNYRAATSRAFINHNPSVSISATAGASGAGPISVHNGTNVRLQAYGADPDGDSLSYKWSNGSTASSIVVNGNGNTAYYNCTVRDPYGGSATSNTIQITWYNRTPSVSIGASATNVSSGTTVWLTAYASDPDGDPVSYYWNTGDRSYRIGVSANGTQRSYYCTVVDKYGASARSNTVTVVWRNNAWTVHIEWLSGYTTDEQYGGSYTYYYAHAGIVRTQPDGYSNTDVMLDPGSSGHYGDYANALKDTTAFSSPYGWITAYVMQYKGVRHYTTSKATGSAPIDEDHSYHAFDLIKTKDIYVGTGNQLYTIER